MQDFELHLPTRLLFGDSHAASFARHAAQLGPRTLLVTGGGSVERLGYLDEVTKLLAAERVAVRHFAGVEPNPTLSTVARAAELARSEAVTSVTALGGGSVLDAAKGIAALSALAPGESLWPYVLGQPKAGQLPGALPVAAIPTTAATASEVTAYAVLSDPPTRTKSVLVSEHVKPRLGWLNPRFTLELSPTTTQDGAADALSHVFENYLLGGDGSPLADGYGESVAATVLATLPVLLAEPGNLAARARMLWAASMALNGFQLAGRPRTQSVLHALEHAVSGFFPTVAHGRGLATLYPAYFRWLWEEGRAHGRLARLGRSLFGEQETDDKRAARRFVERFEGWLRANGLYQSLAALGVPTAAHEPIARKAVEVYGDGERLEALGPLSVADIVTLFDATHRQVA